MFEDVSIRRSTPQDAEGIRAAIDEVAHERKYIALLEAPTPSDVASFIAQPNVVQVVALHGELIVGWADVQRMLCPGFAHRGNLGMGVTLAYRRCGIGERLFAAIMDQAQLIGVTRLELQVFRSNTAAVSLYERHGFQLEGTQVRARILDDIVDDILLMFRSESTLA